MFEVIGSNSLGDITFETNSELGFESKLQFYAQLDSIVPPATAPLQTLYTLADHHVISLLSYLHAVLPAPSRELSSATLFRANRRYILENNIAALFPRRRLASRSQLSHPRRKWYRRCNSHRVGVCIERHFGRSRIELGRRCKRK